MPGDKFFGKKYTNQNNEYYSSIDNKIVEETDYRNSFIQDKCISKDDINKPEYKLEIILDATRWKNGPTQEELYRIYIYIFRPQLTNLYLTKRAIYNKLFPDETSLFLEAIQADSSPTPPKASSRHHTSLKIKIDVDMVFRKNSSLNLCFAEAKKTAKGSRTSGSRMSAYNAMTSSHATPKMARAIKVLTAVVSSMRYSYGQDINILSAPRQAREVFAYFPPESITAMSHNDLVQIVPDMASVAVSVKETSQHNFFLSLDLSHPQVISWSRHGYIATEEDGVIIVAQESPAWQMSLFLAQTSLSSKLISMTKNGITLTKEQYLSLVRQPWFEPLMQTATTLEWLSEISLPVSLAPHLGIKYSDDFSQIMLMPSIEYTTPSDSSVKLYVSHTQPRVYLKTLAGDLLVRDMPWEQTILCEQSTQLQRFSQPLDADNRTYTIDDRLSQVYDYIDTQETQHPGSISYHQSTKKIARKPVRLSMSVASGIDRFDVEYQLESDQHIPADEADLLMQAVVSGQKTYTLTNGTTVLLNNDLKQAKQQLDAMGLDFDLGKEVRKAAAKAASKKGKKNADTPALSATISRRIAKYNAPLLESTNKSFSIDIDKQTRELINQLRETSELPSYSLPKMLKATLRPYQMTGFYWLRFLHQYGFGWILADDMGLGKTIQAITLLASLSEEAKANKQKTWPSIIICPTSLTYNWMDEFAKFAPKLKTARIHNSKEAHDILSDQADIFVVSYGIAANLLEEWLLDIPRYYVILDEAQHIKNAATVRAKALFNIQAAHRLALTGTPIENHLGELRSIFNFVMPWVMGDHKTFQDRYQWGDKESLQMLGKKIKPYIMRRTKEQVLPDLPPKVEETIFLEMWPQQAALYRKMAKTYQELILSKLDEEGLNKTRFAVLDALLKLRQLCLMPQLLKFQGNTVTESIKLTYVTENVAEMIGKWHSLLMFSQFPSFLKYVREVLDAQGISYLYLDGQTKPEDRKKIVADFNDGKAQLFLISLKAGGTWLNLVAADYVIHLDPRRNPAVEQQATDRAHRIGQTKTVFVQKLIVKDTIEQKILALQESKKQLIDDVLGDNFTGTLNEADIRGLFER